VIAYLLACEFHGGSSDDEENLNLRRSSPFKNCLSVVAFSLLRAVDPL